MPEIAIKAAAEGDGLEMSLIGEVGWEISAREIQRGLAGRSGPLTVNLFSYGGDALEGLAIYSMLSRYDDKVKVVVDGLAASAASLIAMAGDEIIMPESSFLMIHEAWGLGVGGANDLRHEADLIDRVTSAYCQVYVQRSGLSEDDVRSLMTQESWLTAAEAVEFGFATEVAAPRALQAMALPEGRFSQLPKALHDVVQWFPARRTATRSAEMVPIAAAAMVTDEPQKEVPKLIADPQFVSSVMTTSIDVAERESAAVQSERERAKTIRNLCEKTGAGYEKAESYIDAGRSVDEVRADLFEMAMQAQGRQKVEIASRMQSANDGLIGMSEREVKRYSILNAIRHFSDPTDARLREAAAFELEASAAAVKTAGRDLRGSFRIPADVLVAQIPGMGSARQRIKASQEAGTFTTGGALVDTDLLIGSMIELIYNRLSITAAGATVLSGLVGDVDIPRETEGPSHYWVNEGGAPPESEVKVGQISLTPKTVGAKTVITRRLIGQTAVSAEAWVRQHLSRKISVGIDEDFIYSPGGNSKPRGLRFTDGVKTETLAGGQTKTIDGTSYNFGTYLNLVEMETKVSLANLDVPSMGYMHNAHSRGAYKTTLENAQSDFYILRNGEINGYPSMMSNQLRYNNVLFGDFSQAILAFWSGQDIGVNPYKYQDSGSVEISILQDCDFGVRYPEAFVFGI